MALQQIDDSMCSPWGGVAMMRRDEKLGDKKSAIIFSCCKRSNQHGRVKGTTSKTAFNLNTRKKWKVSSRWSGTKPRSKHHVYIWDVMNFGEENIPCVANCGWCGCAASDATPIKQVQKMTRERVRVLVLLPCNLCCFFFLHCFRGENDVVAFPTTTNERRIIRGTVAEVHFLYARLLVSEGIKYVFLMTLTRLHLSMTVHWMNHIITSNSSFEFWRPRCGLYTIQ